MSDRLKRIRSRARRIYTREGKQLSIFLVALLMSAVAFYGVSSGFSVHMVFGVLTLLSVYYLLLMLGVISES